MDINDLINEGNSFKFNLIDFGYAINDSDGYAKWKEKCKRFLNLNYTDDKFIESFEKNCGVYNNKRAHSELIGCLEAFRDMPTIAQKQNPKDISVPNTVVNVHQTQQQEQTQSQEIAIHIFLEAIKDELTGKQLKELKAIVAEEPEPEKAKSKIMEKLKSFGESVLTNIVANVITNPAIWGGLM
jgi:hypothetical protein